MKVFHGRRQARIRAYVLTRACTYTSFRASRTRGGGWLLSRDDRARGGAPRTGPLSSLSGERRAGGHGPIPEPFWDLEPDEKDESERVRARVPRSSRHAPFARPGETRLLRRASNSGIIPAAADRRRGNVPSRIALLWPSIQPRE